ncbi:bifunctional metallophosphatase/5'-nucleotidase [Shewanella sp. D64]|uniref:bifunctional metallophosphatase/5'-nucleotidase n=1 Tax=unclassified Shewanella TaxID=196818 RepID=UPI0022BA14FC|nr:MULTISPECIES: bifunctional metallophosphatase/5'-nucleotidase [unclassified Shewanella]MEC4724787.1 bifunctional metallophosphatase/5'-nucleotidase [Shewanella sp. D64]MEC4736419.1 bifunctional metallophosphatase/5'-nucleotidase [Shewanella sp. E94]WBJ97522.1 bifunctional metallophosphatase/5'-nucleotidase [Shewanella sp. MTB7]
MKNTKYSVLCLAILASIAGCSDDKIVEVEVDNGFSVVVTEGRTLTNTPDIIVKSQEEVDELTITIGATADLHGRIFGYDYAIDGEDADAGLTRIATLLKAEKANNPNMILIDIGDTVQGNSAQLFNDDPTHPVVATLNALEFDVWVPGNHEFNFERSFIDRNLNHFNGAVISSNIKWEDNSANYIRAFQIFEVDGAKIAIVGVTPSNVPNWEASAPSHFAGLKFDEELASTRAAVDELIKKYAPDVIVGAFHIGRDSDAGAGVHKIAAEMADKFDVILAGHEHATYIESIAKSSGDEITSTDISVGGSDTMEDKAISGTYNEANRAESVKIIEPGKWGWALAKAEIQLKKNTSGKWEMVDTTLSNITTKDVKEEEDISAQFQYVDDISKEDAQTLLGMVTGDFTPGGGADEAIHEDYNDNIGRLYTTIHTAKVVDTPLMDFVNQIQIRKSGAVVSAASLFSDSSNLLDGQEYAKKDSTNLYEYDNTLVAIEMTGANLKRYMEWSYTYFNTYKEGDLTVSFMKGSKAYMYDQFDGEIEFVVDLTGEAFAMDEDYKVTTEGSRIEIIEIAGKEFDAAATYKVAMNSYRWGSNVKKYGWATDADVKYDSVNESVYAIRDMLTEYVEINKGVIADDFFNPNWEFKQYQKDGAITKERNDGAEGQALWNRLIKQEICVSIDLDNPKYPGILHSLNANDDSTYFVNPNAGNLDPDMVYQGCVPAGK